MTLLSPCLAATSPFKPVAEIVGSGPYRFLPDEYISGARAAYERWIGALSMC
jgi:peptide/nickel transport system substrate-binding protein